MRLLALFVPIALASVLLIAFRAPFGGSGEGPPVPIAIFELKGGGKLFHLEGGAVPGGKAFKTKMNTANITSCIQGNLGCAGEFDVQEISPAGLSYLYVYDATNWGIATDPDPATALVTTLTGLMDGKGRFMFAGNHAASNSNFVLEGKAALEKGTLTPKSVKGKVRAVSTMAEHWGVAGFKSVASVAIP